MEERLGVLLIAFFLLVMKMRSINKEIEIIKAFEKEIEVSKMQIEKYRKLHYAQRMKLYAAVQEHIVALLPKLKWTTDTQKNLYGGRRLKTEAIDEVLNFYFQEMSRSSIDFRIKDITFQLWPKDNEYSIGYIDSYEEVQALRDVGVEVSVDILASLKESYGKKIESLQESIDLWTLKKTNDLK